MSFCASSNWREPRQTPSTSTSNSSCRSLAARAAAYTRARGCSAPEPFTTTVTTTTTTTTKASASGACLSSSVTPSGRDKSTSPSSWSWRRKSSSDEEVYIGSRATLGELKEQKRRMLIPSSSVLAAVVDQYKTLELEIRYELVTQALKLQRFQTEWHWMAGFTYQTIQGGDDQQEGLKYGLIFNVAKEMANVGVISSTSLLDKIQKVIDLRKEAGAMHENGGDQKHKHHYGELERLHSLLENPVRKANKSYNELLKRKSWRPNSA